MPSRRISPIASALVLCGTSIAGAATVKTPVEPSNLKVTPLGVNTFELKWKDNSDNESGWQVFAALKGGVPALYQTIAAPNATSAVIVINELPKKTLVFQVAAYANPTTAGGVAKVSKKTSAVEATALAQTTFGAPTKFTATVVDDGQFRFAWKDNSTRETGYQLQYKGGTTAAWTSIGTVQAGTSFNLSSLQFGVFSPATNYSFRVRAFNQFGTSTVKFTDFSSVVKAKTKAFQPPANLTVKAESDGAFSFKWKDKSSNESAYEVEYKTGSGAFTKVGSYSANVISTAPLTGFSFNTDYQFRVRAVRAVGAASGYSNTVSIKSTTVLGAPTTLAGSPASDTSVSLTWKSASTRASAYEIGYREVGTTTFSTVTVGNVVLGTVSNLSPGKAYEFRLRAVAKDFFGNVTASSPFTSLIQVSSKDGIAGNLHPAIFWGTSFVYPVQISRASALSSLTVTGLPAGLTYNSSTRTISGIATEDGLKTVTLKATFNDASVVTRSLILRIVRPPAAPVAKTAFSAINVTSGANSTVSVTGKFEDPDTTSAARLTTSSGVVDIILYPQATPATVTNFLSYLNNHSYDNGFFHRSVASDNLYIVQGGGYQYTDAVGFARVTKAAAVANEPGISNLKGTIAMAKTANNPNSATSEFFVNLNDANAPNLDAQNEGFTVFGRVSTPTLAVMSGINALTTKDDTVVIGTGSQLLEDVPLASPSANVHIDPALLVKIPTATIPPILTYTVDSGNSAVATATISGTTVTVTGVATGSTSIVVTATDLDGQSVTQNIPVTVP
jgi:cyclophilin family peptidyl-prolyl cis-trans isomerase